MGVIWWHGLFNFSVIIFPTTKNSSDFAHFQHLFCGAGSQEGNW